MHRDRSQHVHAESALINRIGRCGDVQQHVSSLLEKLDNWVAVVAAIRPEILVVPRVFANRHAKRLAMKLHGLLFFRRMEITRFIEHVVRGQQHLALLENDFAAAQQRCLVGDRFQRAVLHSAHESNNRRNRQRPGQRLQLFLVSIDKSRPLEQILGWVSTEAELRKYS